MIDEVKFRGKDINTKQWVYGGYYKHLKRTPSPLGDNILEDDYKGLIIYSGFSDWNMSKPIQCCEVDKNTVSQYIGYKDCDRKEFYEGDIVLIKSYLFLIAPIGIVTEDIYGIGVFGTDDAIYPFDYSIQEGKIIDNIYSESDLKNNFKESLKYFKDINS